MQGHKAANSVERPGQNMTVLGWKSGIKKIFFSGFVSERG